MTLEIPQDLIFVLGKGGTGRSTVAASLATHFANRGERVLIVQWALRDSISRLYGLRDATHETRSLGPNLFAMNFSFEKALEEYFVSHLKMRSVFELVIKNSHVQKVVRAAPGIQELFFLGRLFWLTELSESERGWRYDRVIVDAPASGHGVPLFRLPRTVASFGIVGPIANESERVARLIENQRRVGVVLVATPEELPVHEMLETSALLKSSLGRAPLFGVVNRCIDPNLFFSCSKEANPQWWNEALSLLRRERSIPIVNEIRQALCRRRKFEERVTQELDAQGLNILRIPDAHFLNANVTGKGVISAGAAAFDDFFTGEIA